MGKREEPWPYNRPEPITIVFSKEETQRFAEGLRKRLAPKMQEIRDRNFAEQHFLPSLPIKRSLTQKQTQHHNLQDNFQASHNSV